MVSLIDGISDNQELCRRFAIGMGEFCGEGWRDADGWQRYAEERISIESIHDTHTSASILLERSI